MTLLSNLIAHATIIESLAKERDDLRRLHTNQTHTIGVLLEEAEALRRERAATLAELSRTAGEARQLRARVNELKAAVYPYLYGFGGTITGRASSQPNSQELPKKADIKDSHTPAKSPAFAAPYSGLKAHSVGSQYPFTVVGFESAGRTKYGVQNLITGKWAGYYGGRREWRDAAGASGFIDRYCKDRVFAKADGVGDPILWGTV